jgi:hypothetical protein
VFSRGEKSKCIYECCDVGTLYSLAIKFFDVVNSTILIPLSKNRDSSVGIVLGYWLDDQGSRLRFPAGAGNFSLHHRVQNGSGTHPASYPMGIRGSYPGGKVAGA